MGRSLDRFRSLGLPALGRGHFVVSFCRSVARSTRLDFMGRRILCEKALATKMVSCKLDSYALLLRSCLCSSHSLTLHNFGFGMSYPELYDSHPHFLAGRGSTDKNEQPIEATET